jgi:bifunctional non-homologous end joining protein LigD
MKTFIKKVSLHYCSGSSDKVYHVELVSDGSGYFVAFAYGRRGSTLNHGVKNSKPLDLAKAEALFDSLVREKSKKGYVITEKIGTSPVSSSPKTAEASPAPSSLPVTRPVSSPVMPCLPEAISDADLQDLIHDPAFVCQEKHDGQRVLVEVNDDGRVRGFNKRGQERELPRELVSALTSFAGYFFDGELLGDCYVAFDLLQMEGDKLEAKPYLERLRRLEELSPKGFVQCVVTAHSNEEKSAMLAQIKAGNGEGVVLKSIHAPHTPGKAKDWSKFKFTAENSFIVSAHNAQRSVALEAYDDSFMRVFVGNVTIPPSVEIPPVGSIIEVRYLYAYPGGAVFQPVFVRVRDDQTPRDCQTRKLKLKQATVDAETK